MGDTIPTLAVFDNKCQAVWALPVEEKGANEEAVKWLVDRINEAGYAGQKVFQKHGYTENCPECTHILTGVGHRKAHSEACRKRMQEALVQEGDRKMVEGEERINKWMEDRHKKLAAGEETGDTKVTDDSHKTKGVLEGVR